MRCSFLVKIESLSLQLCNQPNSFTGIVLVFSYYWSKDPLHCEASFGGCLRFMFIVKQINLRKNL